MPVIELGAGTGILTAELVSRELEVIAIEPVDAMRHTILRDVPDAGVREGTAEDIPPLSTDSAGAVIAAQAFHWFEPSPALDEVSRVRRPGGQLLTVWNVRDESVPWVGAYTEIVDRYAGDTPSYRTMDWRRAIESDGRFLLDVEQSTPNPQPASVDKVVARALSTSFTAALPDEEQAAVADQIRGIVDGLGEHFDYPYRSELQAWILRPYSPRRNKQRG